MDDKNLNKKIYLEAKGHLEILNVDYEVSSVKLITEINGKEKPYTPDIVTFSGYRLTAEDFVAIAMMHIINGSFGTFIFEYVDERLLAFRDRYQSSRVVSKCGHLSYAKHYFVKNTLGIPAKHYKIDIAFENTFSDLSYRYYSSRDGEALAIDTNGRVMTNVDAFVLSSLASDLETYDEGRGDFMYLSPKITLEKLRRAVAE